MISYHEMQRMLSELLDELPEAFFSELNGGVSLSEQAPTDPVANDVSILGEYIEDPLLGCSIVLYYGSFVQLFPRSTKNELRQELRATLRHEFRHHLEALAGVDDLGLEDEAEFSSYLAEDAARYNLKIAAQETLACGKSEGESLRKKKGNGWGLLSSLWKHSF